MQTAEELEADWILMMIDGPDVFLGGLRGTAPERILHDAPCSVGSLPAD